MHRVLYKEKDIYITRVRATCVYSQLIKFNEDCIQNMCQLQRSSFAGYITQPISTITNFMLSFSYWT